MSYTTGTANSFEDVLSATRAACAAAGWTVDGSIIYKGGAFVRLTIQTSETTSQGPGIQLEAGTGRSGDALTGATTVAPRLGRAGPVNLLPPVWPATFHIFTFTGPDEVYVVVNSNVEYFHWLAWGVSDVPGIIGSGLWLGGSARRGILSGTAWEPIGLSAVGNGGLFAPALFWLTVAQLNIGGMHAVCSGLDGADWAVDVSARAIDYAAPHIARTPSPWLQAAPLVPLQVWQQRPNNKRSLVVDARNARYIRIDNYTPGELITLGTEQWMVFPWYKKDPVIATGVYHTGPFGWAIRHT